MKKRDALKRHRSLYHGLNGRGRRSTFYARHRYRIRRDVLALRLGARSFIRCRSFRSVPDTYLLHRCRFQTAPESSMNGGDVADYLRATAGTETSRKHPRSLFQDDEMRPATCRRF